MIDSEPKNGELEQSHISIRKLEKLLHTIDNVEVISQTRNHIQAPDDSVREQHWAKNFFKSTALLVTAEHAERAQQIIASIENSLRRLTIERDNAARRSQSSSVDVGPRHANSQIWTLGTVVYCLEKRSILRGEVELSRAHPIAPNIPEWLVLYLASVPGTRDQISREIHGHWGYHYHYLDSNARRSDTLLTFDQSTQSTGNPVLCWERHAEKQKFRARADTWKDEKRKSVYYVCHPDTIRFALSDFKRPASDALLVWP